MSLPRSWGLVVVTAVGVLLLAGCGDDGAGVRVDPTDSAASVPTETDRTVADIEPCPRSGAVRDSSHSLPDVELACLGPGDPVQMAGLSGRPMVVNVWASWCKPCRDEMPILQRLADEGQVVVLGVDAEDQSAAASALLEELDITYPSVFDPSNSFARAVGVVTKPMSLLVSPEGDVVKTVPGPFESYDDLVAQVEAELDVTTP